MHIAIQPSSELRLGCRDVGVSGKGSVRGDMLGATKYVETAEVRYGTSCWGENVSDWNLISMIDVRV